VASPTPRPTRLSLTPEETLTLLQTEAKRLLARPRRTILGVAGGPGVGKSTFARELVARLNDEEAGAAAYVPMDGFHMKHAKLEEQGIVADKGMPHTFEAQAFVDFLLRLKGARETTFGPDYSRKIEDVVDDAIVIDGATRLLVVEGNYLLLDDGPWAKVKALLDRAVYVEVPRETVRARLLKRHAEEGLFTEEHIRRHVETRDLVNYDLVSTTKQRADLAIDVKP
jgi:pantothenate kinase